MQEQISNTTNDMRAIGRKPPLQIITGADAINISGLLNPKK